MKTTQLKLHHKHVDYAIVFSQFSKSPMLIIPFNFRKELTEREFQKSMREIYSFFRKLN